MIADRILPTLSRKKLHRESEKLERKKKAPCLNYYYNAMNIHSGDKLVSTPLTEWLGLSNWICLEVDLVLY